MPEGTKKGDMERIEEQEDKKDKIVCLECGMWFKEITAGHLKKHGMTVQEYREKHDMPKGLPLTAAMLNMGPDDSLPF